MSYVNQSEVVLTAQALTIAPHDPWLKRVAKYSKMALNTKKPAYHSWFSEFVIALSSQSQEIRTARSQSDSW